jgi:hypothetical protein
MKVSGKIVDEIIIGDIIEKTTNFQLKSLIEYPMITLEDILQADSYYTMKKAKVKGLFIQKDDGLTYQIKGIKIGDNGIIINLPAPNGLLTITTEDYTIKLFVAPSNE